MMIANEYGVYTNGWHSEIKRGSIVRRLTKNSATLVRPCHGGRMEARHRPPLGVTTTDSKPGEPVVLQTRGYCSFVSLGAFKLSGTA